MSIWACGLFGLQGPKWLPRQLVRRPHSWGAVWPSPPPGPLRAVDGRKGALGWGAHILSPSSSPSEGPMSSDLPTFTTPAISLPCTYRNLSSLKMPWNKRRKSCKSRWNTTSSRPASWNWRPKTMQIRVSRSQKEETVLARTCPQPCPSWEGGWAMRAAFHLHCESLSYLFSLFTWLCVSVNGLNSSAEIKYINKVPLMTKHVCLML